MNVEKVRFSCMKLRVVDSRMLRVISSGGIS